MEWFEREVNNSHCITNTVISAPRVIGPAVSKEGGFRNRARRFVERHRRSCVRARGAELVHPGADRLPGGET